MKKIIAIILGIVILAALVYADDLEDFPNLFVDSNKLDAIVVVGNKGSAVDVISQSNLIQFFVTNGIESKNTAKLSNEVSDMDQNIISIGNPCTNDLTLKILGNPKPCDDDINKNRAYIKLFENGRYNYLLVYGYDDKLTKKAVDVLINYASKNLEGTEITIDESGKILSRSDDELEYSSKKANAGEETVISEAPSKPEPIIIVPNTTIVKNETKTNNIATEIKIDSKTVKNETPVRRDLIVDEESKGFFSKLWNWIKSIFD